MSDLEVVYLKDLEHNKASPDIRTIEDWFKRGHVTLFAGAAISSRGQETDATSTDALRRLTAALEQLKKPFASKKHANELAFISAFEKAYGPMRRTEKQPAPGGPSASAAEGSPSPPVEPAVHENWSSVRYQLVILITALTRHFNRAGGEAAKRHSSFYFSQHPTEIAIDPALHDDVFEALTGLLDATKPLLSTHAATDWGKLLVAGIYPEICSWIALHMPVADCEERWRQHKATFAKVSNTLKSVYGDYAGNDMVTQTDLEWLSELLWLTLRIDLPFYPNSHELAVELGVFSEKLFPPTPILSKSAEAVSTYSEVAEYVAKRFNIKSTSPRQHRRVRVTDAHHVLAATLLHMTETSVGSQKSGRERPKSGHTELIGSITSKPACPAVLFTTNFDWGIEQALERIIIEGHEQLSPLDNGDKPPWPSAYRVVFPILLPRRAGHADSGFDIRWVIKDRLPRDPSRSSYKVISPSVANNALSEHSDPHSLKVERADDLFIDETKVDLVKGVSGPVIVKLHGSPLESIDELNDRGLRCIHYIIASEYHYVSALKRRTFTDLDCIEKLLMIPMRHLIFLGYSLGDWNIRVALAQHAQRAVRSGGGGTAGPQTRGEEGTAKQQSENTYSGTPNRLALVKDRALSDVALFNRLDVMTLNHDLRNFIVNVARIEAIRPYLLKDIRAHLGIESPT